LTNPRQQITAYVMNVIRSTVPRLKLDQVFEAKEEIAHAVRDQLEKVMGTFGYSITQALVTDIEPDARVKAAMNEINAAQRHRVAAADQAEAQKIVTVKAAEAEAESKYLSGLGVARQRKAIVDGLRDSVTAFSEAIEGTSPKDVMDLLLMNQYFDTLKDIGANPKSTTIFIPQNPGSVDTLSQQVRDGFIQGAAAGHHVVGSSVGSGPIPSAFQLPQAHPQQHQHQQQQHQHQHHHLHQRGHQPRTRLHYHYHDDNDNDDQLPSALLPDYNNNNKPIFRNRFSKSFSQKK